MNVIFHIRFYIQYKQQAYPKYTGLKWFNLINLIDAQHYKSWCLFLQSQYCIWTVNMHKPKQPRFHMECGISCNIGFCIGLRTCFSHHLEAVLCWAYNFYLLHIILAQTAILSSFWFCCGLLINFGCTNFFLGFEIHKNVVDCWNLKIQLIQHLLHIDLNKLLLCHQLLYIGRDISPPPTSIVEWHLCNNILLAVENAWRINVWYLLLTQGWHDAVTLTKDYKCLFTFSLHNYLLSSMK